MRGKMTTASGVPPTLPEIEQPVLAVFNETRVGDAWAVRQWRKECKEARAAEQDAEVVHRFRSPEVIAARP